MISLLVAVMLSGAPGVPAKVAMPGMNVIGFDDQRASFFAEHLAQQLKFEGLQVVTNKEISTLLGFERQKVLLGCNESTSCIAELASALGADAVLLGDLAKIGSKLQLNLKIISAIDGKTLAAHSDRVDGEEALLDALSRAAERLAQGVSTALNRPLSTTLRGASSSGGSLWWVPAVAGAVVAGIGGGLFISGNADYQRLISATPEQPLPLSDAASLRDGGKLKEGLAVGCFAAGGAAIVAGVIMFATTRGPAKATVSAVPLVGGGAVVVSGVLP